MLPSTYRARMPPEYDAFPIVGHLSVLNFGSMREVLPSACFDGYIKQVPWSEPHTSS